MGRNGKDRPRASQESTNDKPDCSGEVCPEPLSLKVPPPKTSGCSSEVRAQVLPGKRSVIGKDSAASSGVSNVTADGLLHGSNALRRPCHCEWKVPHNRRTVSFH